MGKGEEFRIVFLFFLIAATSPDVLESKLQTPSGLIERFKSSDDESRFSVKLTSSDEKKPDEKKVEWLETPPTQNQSLRIPGKIIREVSGRGEMVIFQRSDGSKAELGFSARQFDLFNCSAHSRVQFPTPLDNYSEFDLANMKCDEADQNQKTPITEFQSIKVVGEKDQSWVKCHSFNEKCEWDSIYDSEPQASIQTSTTTFLWKANQMLSDFKLNAFLPDVLTKAQAWTSDRSMYDANLKTLYFGMGKFPDGRDGFVVIHEWTHSLIDTMNPKIWGYQGGVMHEAVADFVASNYFGEPCFAPYDAQEVPNRKCLRDLQTLKIYPQDMHWDDKHYDSIVLSGALWEARSKLDKIAVEVVLETLIRLPKNPTLTQFWTKLMKVYSRILAERSDLKDYQSDVREIGKKHGLVE